jgi:hypothetical protein
VLGKRADAAEAVFDNNFNFKASAYQDDIEAASSADVLGKRANTPAIFDHNFNVKSSAYVEDIEAASSADVLGEVTK